MVKLDHAHRMNSKSVKQISDKVLNGDIYYLDPTLPSFLMCLRVDVFFRKTYVPQK